MSSQVRLVLWNYDEVPDALRYLTMTAGTRIRLACLIGLNDIDDRRFHRSAQERPEHHPDDDAQKDGNDHHIEG